MKATGQMLKERREALKISIAEVSISTKITSRMIQAIESGNMDILPARSFLRGFIKSYAAYLKMDQEAILKSFNEDLAALEPAPVLPIPTENEGHAGPAPKVDFTEAQSEQHEFLRDGLSPVKKASLGLGLVGLVVTIVLVYQLVQKYERESQVEAPPTSLSKIEPSPAPVTAAEIVPDEDPRPTIDAAPPGEIKNPVDAKPPGGEPAKPLAEVKPPVVVAKPVAQVKSPDPAPQPIVEAKPVVEAKPTPVVAPEAPKPTLAAPASTRQEIIIEALDKVEISFRVNNGDIRKISLAPDQVHTIKAAGVVAIEMSDGGAVNVIHNGRDVGVPGDLGRPKKIQFP